jgi:hypothetical protein
MSAPVPTGPPPPPPPPPPPRARPRKAGIGLVTRAFGRTGMSMATHGSAEGDPRG